MVFTRNRETRECAKPRRDGRLRRARWKLLPLYFVAVLASANAATAPDSGVQALQARILTLATTATNAEAAFIEATSDCSSVSIVVENTSDATEDLKCTIVFRMTDRKADTQLPPHLQQALDDLLAAATITNRVSKRVCEAELTRSLCTSPFAPAWLFHPEEMKPTMASLQDWTSETEAAARPLWAGLWALAAKRKGQPQNCSDH